MNAFDPFSFHINYNHQQHEVTAVPLPDDEHYGTPFAFYIAIDGKPIGNISFGSNKWRADAIEDQAVADMIGSYIHTLYG